MRRLLHKWGQGYDNSILYVRNCSLRSLVSGLALSIIVLNVLLGCQRPSTTSDIAKTTVEYDHQCIADRGKTYDNTPQPGNFALSLPETVHLGTNSESIADAVARHEAYVRNLWFKGIALDDSTTLTRKMLHQTAQITRTIIDKSVSDRDSLLLSKFNFYQLSGDDSLGNVLFTGYFTPVLQVKSVRDSIYRYPFYKKPGRRGGFPLPDRREIDFLNALDGKNLEIAWSDNLFDNFVLQVQGSGIVRFEDGREQILAYGGKNGYPYTSIGKHLIALGEIEQEDISLSAIREWLARHPERMREILSVNES
ncbi:MAG: MltA domain-containing protein, partial [Bacteroidota bacterium]